MVSKKEGSTSFYDRFRDRLIFPIHDELSRVVGFSARILSPDAKAAKYVNSPESDFFQKGSVLYGLNHARANLKTFGNALVCEGQLDVIACHRAGLATLWPRKARHSLKTTPGSSSAPPTMSSLHLMLTLPAPPPPNEPSHSCTKSASRSQSSAYRLAKTRTASSVTAAPKPCAAS